MNEKFDDLLDRIEKEVERFSRYGFIVRAIELQKDAVEDLNELLIEIKDIKEQFIQRENEPCANSLLSYELFVKGLIYEIQMLIEIKEDNPSKAWDSLVSAQTCVEASLRIGFRSEELLKNYVIRLHYLEKLLFPLQMFMSVGFIAEESHCSLCEDDYENCDHIKGMAYMGKMCVEIFKKCYKLEEVSIVDNPADKRCRVYTIGEEGKKIDFLTLREIKGEEE